MLKQLSPRGIKALISAKIEAAYIARRKRIELDIPKVALQQKHINNLKTILSRELMLDLFPKNAVVAEIGVFEGKFSQSIVNIAQPAKFHLVDLWSNGAPDDRQQMVQKSFSKEIESGKIEMHVGYSTTWIPKFADAYFDWVYLDTDHSYSLTAKELDLLKTKIKPGGILAGHDYILGNWISGYRYGVIEAVHEFCVREGWEIIYLTIEADPYHSFALRKL